MRTWEHLSSTHWGEEKQEPVWAKSVAGVVSRCRMRYNTACSYAASSGALLETLTLFREPGLFPRCSDLAAVANGKGHLCAAGIPGSIPAAPPCLRLSLGFRPVTSGW
jgi:hypothetical protein